MKHYLIRPLGILEDVDAAVGIPQVQTVLVVILQKLLNVQRIALMSLELQLLPDSQGVVETYFQRNYSRIIEDEYGAITKVSQSLDHQLLIEHTHELFILQFSHRDVVAKLSEIIIDEGVV